MHMNSMNSLDTWIDVLHEFLYLCEVICEYEFECKWIYQMNSSIFSVIYMITLNLWFHICHEFIHSIVRVFVCSDTCVWILWIHWIHELICYMNSFVCVKSYVITNYMNSLNTWFELTAEFTLVNVFYNHFTSM